MTECTVSPENRSPSRSWRRKVLITAACAVLLTILAISAVAFRHVMIRPAQPPDRETLFGYVKSGDLKSLEKAVSSHPELIAARDGNGFSLAHVAVEAGSSPEEALKSLITLRADIDSGSACEGETPLHIAAEKGLTECVKILLDSGASVDTKDGILGQTPLHRACLYNHLQTASLLLDHNACVSAADSAFGDTPLHKAALKGYREMVELLLRRGADVNKGDRKGKSAIEIAGLFGKEEEADIMRGLSHPQGHNTGPDLTPGPDTLQHTGVESDERSQKK